MPHPSSYSFARYLSAKKSVDDRALNRHAWDALKQEIALFGGHRPFRILEIGAGIGTMIERIAEWRLLSLDASYTAIDPDPSMIEEARQRTSLLAARHGTVKDAAAGQEIVLTQEAHQLKVDFAVADVGRSTSAADRQDRYDLVIAHAVLDLLDVPTLCSRLPAMLTGNSLLYLTINFDGATILEPLIDPEFDRLVEETYHRTMDERMVAGRPSGGRHTGRHLFQQLTSAGMKLVAAGSSDWVVFPGVHGYPHDEAYFLHFIIHTIDLALRDRPEIDRGKLSAWVAARQAQIERQELVYITHQVDILARQ